MKKEYGGSEYGEYGLARTLYWAGDGASNTRKEAEPKKVGDPTGLAEMTRKSRR